MINENNDSNKNHTAELRKFYIENPPEGMTPELVRGMSDGDLLDMHDFLTEEDDFEDDTFEDGFYIF